MNFVRYQNEGRYTSKTPLTHHIACGKRYGTAELSRQGQRRLTQHREIWIPDGLKITDCLSVTSTNGQLVGMPEEDDYVYFWISGRRGTCHNWHRQLLIPKEVEVIATGAKAAHERGCCNKITSVIFRVPKEVRSVILGDVTKGTRDWEVIEFTRDGNGSWSFNVDPYNRFAALNPAWSGSWMNKKFPTPLPALVE